MTGTSGKGKNGQCRAYQKVVYDKPDPAKIEAKIAAQAKAAKEARLKAAEEKQAAERSKKAAERQAATLAAMRANSEPVKIMRLMRRLSSKDKNPEDAKPADKAEKPIRKTCQTHQKESATDKKRVKLVKQKKSVCVRWRQKHAVKLPKKLKNAHLSRWKQMASRYSDADDGATAAIVRTKDDAPLADGLVGAALEESFEKERREIKRGATGTAGKGGKKAAKVSKKSVK